MKRFRRRIIERDIEEELRFHLEMRAQQNRASGMSGDDAETDALKRFGDYNAVKAQCNEITRDRLANSPARRILTTLVWIMLGSGITLKLLSDIPAVSQCGTVLIMISLMWRLLLYLRQNGLARREPILHSASSISLQTITPEYTHPCADHYDEHGRTPVERILSDE